MAKTHRKQPYTDKPKRKYKRNSNKVRTVLRSTFDHADTEELESYGVLANQLSAEDHSLGSYQL